MNNYEDTEMQNVIDGCGHPAECETKSRMRDALEMEQFYRERQTRPARLFVIRQRGRQLYWTCSTTHGSGWHPQFPKQAFSKSELASELSRMIEHGHFSSIEILELSMPKWTEEGSP